MIDKVELAGELCCVCKKWRSEKTIALITAPPFRATCRKCYYNNSSEKWKNEDLS